MSFILLKEYLFFEKNQDNYTDKEKEEIILFFKKQLKKKCSKFMKV